MSEDKEKKKDPYPGIILVIDIETTGFEPELDHIVELGGVLLNTKNGRIKKLFNYLIKEPGFGERHRNSWIFNNSNLKFDKVMKKGKSLEDLRFTLQNCFNRYTVTSYNQMFDFGFLRERNFTFPNTTHDPMILLTDKFGKWPKVQEAIDSFSWKIVEPHRALKDAKIEAKIIREMIKRGWWNE